MAETITLSITTAQGTLTRTRSFPDGSATRLVASTKARLGLDPAATNAQTFSALADEIFGSIQQNNLNWEHQQGAAQVVVQPMPLT